MPMHQNRTLKTLTVWAKRQIYGTRAEGKCVRFVLNHLAPNQKVGSEVFSITIGDNIAPGEKVDDTAIEAYAAEIINEADTYTDGIGGTQSFVACSIFEDDKDRIVSRHAFRCHREEDEDDFTAGSEPPTSTGMISQQMRHTEAIMRQNGAMFGQAITTLVKQNTMLSDIVEKFLETRVNELEAAEELISAKHTRDLELKREERSAENQGKMIETAMALLPAVANRMVGRKILPETTDSSLMALVKLAETLTPEQVEAMSSVMEPGQKIAFFELLQSIQQRQAEAHNASINGKPS